MDKENRDHGFFSGLLSGVALGAGLFFLFGTKEGKKVKNRLVKKGKELIDDLPVIVEDLEKQGEEFAQKAEEVKKKLEEKAKEFSSEAKKKIDASLSQIEKTQERGRKAAASARRRFFVRKGKKLG